ncbi:helix-turn-helix transcriptional regulator [Duganella sp. HH101]|uniref:helix-turn-helix transcriptional regulator n=1 Tax=Duganella sp. HH101 TaxID=1781066 RepID=UPI0008FC253D
METSLFYKKVGSAIRGARDAAGLTQSELASTVGVSRTSLTNIELGRQRLLVDQLVEIAMALQVSVPDLLPMDSQTHEEPGPHEYESLPAVSDFLRSVRSNRDIA